MEGQAVTELAVIINSIAIIVLGIALMLHAGRGH
jgi:hypothetical protein